MNAKRLTTPKEKVRELQEKLGYAAKVSKKRRFHAVYDKVYRWDVLQEAWRRVKANKGASGIDQPLADIEKAGVETFLLACQQELSEGKYRPLPVRRQYIPKKESAASTIGHINFDTKLTGKRSAGNPHAAFDEAGAGSGQCNSTAPDLDPTNEEGLEYYFYFCFSLYCRKYNDLHLQIGSGSTVLKSAR